jgi:hypothetical protein
MSNITGFDLLYLIDPPTFFQVCLGRHAVSRPRGMRDPGEKRAKSHGKHGVLHAEFDGKNGVKPCWLNEPVTCGMSILWGRRGHKIGSPYPLGSLQERFNLRFD